MGVGDLFILLIFWGFCLQAHVAISQKNDTCNSNDLRALEGFMGSLDSGIEGWGFDNTSSSSLCCSWVGIACESSRVVELNLGKKRLNGVLNESIADLDQLRFLNLSQNSLIGQVPMKLFQMKKLETLDLSYNDFLGVMTQEIDLPSIGFLDLSENSFAGTIGTGICLNSSRIQVLNFSMNYFTGTFPVGFGNCTTLKHLVLHSNSLSGNFPDDLFSLRNLNRLDVQFNQFSGLLSDRIGNLSNLVELDISFNGFNGALPNVMGNLQKLEFLSTDSNQFNGTLPTSLSNSPSIKVLNLRNNSLSGPINLNCTSMVLLNTLNLGSNQFHGPFPDSLSSCQKLRSINLARNNLNSQIPESFKNLQYFSYLSLTNTSLHNISSALGVLQHCRSLSIVVLTGNFYDEEMPSDAKLKFENLTALVIANCRLTGLIPQWLSGSTKLQLLDLSWNHLSGTIPDWFGGMKFLFYLDISNNSLSGEIPKSLSKMESLISRNISFDEATEFPFFIKRNQSARGMQYNQILSFPPSLDFSDNMLTGQIPPDLGDLKQLHRLDLKQNSISGSIPSELSGMKSLEILELSRNNLSGVIPPSLNNLSFLSKFDVSYNNLSGKIPQGGQWSTFPNTSFEGNKDLCGDYSNPCSRPERIPLSPTKTRKNTIEVGMVLSIGAGFAVGIFVFGYTLLFKESWRYAYFVFIEKMHRGISMFLKVKMAKAKEYFRDKAR
ncbi:hypothetical protein GIB67_035935 [Kingdonia uniflora]|uniref:Phytosulfokine receptor n=1 Tax=Kingdonia uniflora TaxID=39325 RepID=A0A7J7N114_9MAGN|nr:hypothetical protein GIB67_035935 [Kingdonia uniflora]